jgi:hypothetical protein
MDAFPGCASAHIIAKGEAFIQHFGDVGRSEIRMASRQ